METYEVEYQYYQYNSGKADNGIKTNRTKELPNLQAAQDIVDKIKKSAELSVKANKEGFYQLTEAEQNFQTEMVDSFMNYDGYFKGEPVIYEVTRKQIK